MALQVSGQNTNNQGTAPFRQTYDTSLLSADAHARFQQAVLSGRAFISSNQTGVTTQAGLSATTPVLTLANPKGNTNLLVLWYAGLTLSVATGAGGLVVWVAANTNIAAAAVTGTVATFSNCLVGNTNNPSGQILTAATLPAAPVAIATLGYSGSAATTAVTFTPVFSRQFDGSIIVTPGGALSLQTSAASGASASFGEFIWEEIPISALNS